MTAKNSSGKGGAAEEALRAYFRRTGCFVVRGIPLVYKCYDITDVDLWLYVKTSFLFAERACVDIKNKKTPQAMERILWTRGLKEILGIDRAFVVTTDNRPETREFGMVHGVGVFQGDFFQRVKNDFQPSCRLSEDEFLALLKTPCIVNSDIEWRTWFRNMKARLLNGLNFNGCNSFLLGCKLVLDEYLATDKNSEAPVRLLYALIAYLLICLDYTARTFVALDTPERLRVLSDGLRYGEIGRQKTEEVMQMAFQFLMNIEQTTLFSKEILRNEFDKQVTEYHTEVLAEHFVKAEALKSLFRNAYVFEEFAYAQILQRPHELPNEQKAVLGLLCDFLRHDRKMII